MERQQLVTQMDAGELRQYLAERYGRLLVYGGEYSRYVRFRTIAGFLGRKIGLTADQVQDRIKRDYLQMVAQRGG